MIHYRNCFCGILLLFLIILLTMSCARKTQYGDAAAQEALTVDFGSSDLQMIAQKMVSSLLTAAVIQEVGLPTIQVLRVANKTDEHIDTKAITDKIRTALLQSGKIRFVAAEVRDEIIRELEYQAGSGYVDKATCKRLGKQIGADFLLSGELTSIRKKSGRKTDLYFKITLNLVELETGLIRWAEEKEIRKELVQKVRDDVAYSIEFKKSLEPDPGGKMKMLINKVNQDQ